MASTLLEKLGAAAATVTATSDGLTTGLIPTTQTTGPIVTVASDSAAKKISLPAGTLGDIIRLSVGATGCYLIAVTGADKVNNVTVGATNQLALLANSMYTCTYVSTNNWLVRAEGVVTKGAPKLAVTAALTTISIADAAGTPDYALQALTTTLPYGLATAQEMVSLLYVIQNLQLRVLELEGGTTNAITPAAIS